MNDKGIALRAFAKSNKVDTILTDVTAVSYELNAVENSIGLTVSGKYVAPNSSYYLESSTSVMDALSILDAKIKELENLITP